MLDMHGIPNTATRRCALALVVGIGLCAALPGCAYIHPEDDAEAGTMDSTNEGAVHEREHEAESEHVGEGQERPR
jgi:hypothetical protein